MFTEAALTRLNEQQYKLFFCATGPDGDNQLCYAAKRCTKINKPYIFKVVINKAAIFLDTKEFKDTIEVRNYAGESARSYVEQSHNPEFMRILNEAITLNESIEGRASRLLKRTTMRTKGQLINRLKNTKRIAFNNGFLKEMSNEATRRNETQIRIDNEKFKSGDQVVSILPIFSALAQNRIQ
jgi:hypothetical protein